MFVPASARWGHSVVASGSASRGDDSERLNRFVLCLQREVGVRLGPFRLTSIRASRTSVAHHGRGGICNGISKSTLARIRYE